MKHLLSIGRMGFDYSNLSKKDFSLTEIVLGGHDELEVSQLSLLPGSGRAGSEIGLGEVRSGLQGLGSYICTCTHVHTHNHKKQ